MRRLLLHETLGALRSRGEPGGVAEPQPIRGNERTAWVKSAAAAASITLSNSWPGVGRVALVEQEGVRPKEVRAFGASRDRVEVRVTAESRSGTRRASKEVFLRWSEDGPATKSPSGIHYPARSPVPFWLRLDANLVVTGRWRPVMRKYGVAFRRRVVLG